MVVLLRRSVVLQRQLQRAIRQRWLVMIVLRVVQVVRVLVGMVRRGSDAPLPLHRFSR